MKLEGFTLYMQKADSILHFIDIPNFSAMDFKRSLLLKKKSLYKKIVSTMVIHLKLYKN